MNLTQEEVEKLTEEIINGTTTEIPDIDNTDDQSFLKFLVGMAVYMVSISKYMDSINKRLESIELMLASEDDIGRA
jgi:chaperonin cofactor prefoldin